MTKQTLRIVASPAFKNAHENPYNKLLYSAIAARDTQVEIREYTPGCCYHGCDIAHLHWPEGTWSHPFLLRSLSRAYLLAVECAVWRAKGTKVVWTVHNAEPHDLKHRRLGHHCAQMFVRGINGAIFLSSFSKERITRQLPTLQHKAKRVIPHGDYVPVLKSSKTAREARRSLGLTEDSLTVGAIGRLRPYKNLGVLVDAFAGIPDKHYQLIIAGLPDASAEVSDVLHRAKQDVRVHLELGLLSELELQRVTEACDLLVFPHFETLNSGSVIYALSNGRSVLVPRTPGMEELARGANAHFFQFFNRTLTSAELLSALQYAGKADRLRNAMFPSWSSIADQHLEFFRSLKSSDAPS
jgi:beta-1,4-mannosyltransferase